MAVIERIVSLMAREQISAKKLTTDLGLANSSISEWKKGKARPSLEAVVKIAGYFGVTTDYLLLGKEPSVLEADPGEPERRKLEEFRPSGGASGTKPPPEWSTVSQQESDGLRNGDFRERALSGEEKRLLECYRGLDPRDQEYIRCKLIVLEREAAD